MKKNSLFSEDIEEWVKILSFSMRLLGYPLFRLTGTEMLQDWTLRCLELIAPKKSLFLFSCYLIDFFSMDIEGLVSTFADYIKIGGVANSVEVNI